jgi:hypothetical protein
MEIKASSFKLRANAPKGQKRFPISQRANAPKGQKRFPISFWSFIAPSVCPSWRMPAVAEALDFAMEENPRLCVELNGGRIPLGFHAWTKFDRAFVEGLMKEARE